jgi:hypothetical protein
VKYLHTIFQNPISANYSVNGCGDEGAGYVEIVLMKNCDKCNTHSIKCSINTYLQNGQIWELKKFEPRWQIMPFILINAKNPIPLVDL